MNFYAIEDEKKATNMFSLKKIHVKLYDGCYS